MIGKTVLHYTILEKLGEGGMGVVYLAEDAKLERQVAIKFLPHQIATNSDERKRFEIEAKAAAALNHPNIATIFAIEEADDEMFLVMEYITGKHLKDHINSKPLSIEEAVNLAIQIADGLQVAHKKDIFHRDVKSTNIMSTELGQIKIMDFGLAKFRGSGELTKIGTTIGTAAYMSPEQARGEEVDHRTDIWALGVILYEMITGQTPFKGTYDQAIFYSILNEEQKPMTGLRSGIPLELERIVNKVLKKEPDARYQNMSDLLVDLKNLTKQSETSVSSTHTVPSKARNKKKIYRYIGALCIILIFTTLYFLFKREPITPIDSIAVLPLENLSKDPEQEYFVDGMTEAIITELSKIGALRVISRTSIMQYKDKKVSLASIADELNVTSILEGSVIQSDEQVRITVQLIGLSPERHIWANSYDRDLTGFLSLSSEVATEIASEIEISLTPDEKKRLHTTRKVNPEAHRYVLKAQHIRDYSTTKETTEKSIEYLHKALEIDPNFALAYLGLANAYLRYSNTGYTSYEDILPKVKSSVNKALELDNTLSEAYGILSNIKFREDKDWKDRENILKKAIKLNPSSADAHIDYGMFLSSLCRHEEAMAEIKLAQQLDPLSEDINIYTARRFYFARNYDKAIERYLDQLELDPDDINTKWWLGKAYTQKGFYEKSITEFLSRKVKSPETNWALAYTYAISGQKEKAIKILNFLLYKTKKTYVPPSYIAQIYIALGNKDKAFEWLDKSSFLASLKMDPWYDSIRNDTRFQILLQKMNFPE
jgi:non-specific serine/threonine protein kinase